jgi:hypothetical protein
MKRIQKFAAVNVLAALIGTGVPAVAEQRHDNAYDHARVQYQQRRDHDRRDVVRTYRDDRGYGYAYAPAPVYQPAPVYAGPVYYDEGAHDARTGAIIGGSAAAGALIGAAAGHGQGAVIGAVIGGIAGAVASAAANHHDRY